MTEDRVDALIAAWRTELPEAITPASEFAKRVLELGDAVRAAIRSALEPLELTVAEYDVLAALRRAGAPYHRTPGALASELLLSTGGTTKAVHALTARGLTERIPNPADARSRGVRLTDAGVALAERAVLASTAAQHRLLAAAPAGTLRCATTAVRALSTELRAGRSA